MGLLDQIGLANPGLVFSQIDAANRQKQQAENLERLRQEQVAQTRQRWEEQAPARALQSKLLEQQTQGYRTPEQKQEAELAAYEQKQRIESMFRKPDKPDKPNYQYFDRPDGVYAFDPMSGKSWKMQGVPGKPTEQKSPVDQYAKPIADLREIEKSIASIASGQNIADAALGSGRGEQVARLTSQRDNIKNWLVSQGVDPGSIGYGAEAYGQARPGISMSGEAMREQRQGQPQMPGATSPTTGEFDGKNVSIDGKQYPVGADGTVTINGVKYRVRQ